MWPAPPTHIVAEIHGIDMAWVAEDREAVARLVPPGLDPALDRVVSLLQGA